MVKCHCGLYESLKKLLLPLWRSPPDVFQHFMRLEKFSTIEKLHAMTYVARNHLGILPQVAIYEIWYIAIYKFVEISEVPVSELVRLLL